MAASSPQPTRTLSEAASKQLLRPFGIPFPQEAVVRDADEAAAAAAEMACPVVVKLCGDAIAHKTERSLVRLSLGDAAAVHSAADELLRAARPEDGDVSLLVAPMLSSTRELIAGIAEDPQFGPTVMVGLGGVLAEAIADVTVRLVPIGEVDAEEMIDDLATPAVLDAFRGEPPVARAELVSLLVGLSRAAEATPELVSADCNPVLIVDGHPIAVDALVEVRC